MAIPIFHNLVHSSVKHENGIMGLLCFNVCFFRGVPAAAPGDAFACVPGGSASEFQVGRATSCDEGPSFVQAHGLCIKIVTLFHFVFTIFGTITEVWFFICVSETSMISSGCDDIPTKLKH